MDIEKGVDAIVRAPLWLLLAAAIATTAPLLPIPYIDRLGIDSHTKVFELPLPFYTIVFWTLALASFMSRSLGWGIEALSDWRMSHAKLRKYGKLSPDSKFFLSQIDDAEVDSVPMLRLDPVVTELRDRGLLELSHAARGDTRVAYFAPTNIFNSDRANLREKLRPLLRKGVGSQHFLQRLEQAEEIARMSGIS